MSRLGLICLENRRKRADLILTWKIIHGAVSINFRFPLVQRSHDRPCRGHSFSLLPPHERPPKTRTRVNFFTERVTKLWNALPDYIVSAPSLSTFKGRLDFYWSAGRNLPPCVCEKASMFCIPQPIL